LRPECQRNRPPPEHAPSDFAEDFGETLTAVIQSLCPRADCSTDISAHSICDY